ncbi:rCG24652, isoform CRA_a, partial [Rattus norvegicus]
MGKPKTRNQMNSCKSVSESRLPQCCHYRRSNIKLQKS